MGRAMTVGCAAGLHIWGSWQSLEACLGSRLEPWMWKVRNMQGRRINNRVWATLTFGGPWMGKGRGLETRNGVGE